MNIFKNVISFIILLFGTGLNAQSVNDSLINAAINNDLVALAKFVRQGANVNYVDAFQTTSIMRAIVNQNVAAVNILIFTGSNLEIGDADGNTPLMIAIHNQRNNDFGVLNSLIIAGAKCSVQNKYGESPLIIAIISQNIDVVNAIIRYGANLNKADNLGVTPLEYSQKFGLTAITSSIVNSINNYSTINWNGNWAYGCRFDTTNLEILKSTNPSKCSYLCSTNNACTHFTWVSYNDGYCFLKIGVVIKNTAVNTNNNNIICGLKSTITTSQTTTTTPTIVIPLSSMRFYINSSTISNGGGTSFSDLYGYDNDGIYNYVIDHGINKVFKFSSSWVYLSSTNLPFSLPNYLKYVSGNWFITGNYGIYKTDSTFSTIVASATSGAHYGLYYYSTSSTIYAVKSNSVIEYTTGLAVSYTNSISGIYILWSITATGNTFYIGTTSGTILVMVNRLLTGSFTATCGSSVNSLLIQGPTLLTECSGDSFFHTGNGSSFTYLSVIGGPGYTAKGVWIALQNQLIRTDGSNFLIYY